MRRLLLGSAFASFALAVLTVAEMAVSACHGPLPIIDTAAKCCMLGTVLTWALAVIAGIEYGLAAPDESLTGERSMYCLSCGYILLGLLEGRCPECGRPFDPDNVRTFRRFRKESGRHWVVLAYCWLAVTGLLLALALAGFLAFMGFGILRGYV